MALLTRDRNQLKKCFREEMRAGEREEGMPGRKNGMAKAYPGKGEQSLALRK